MKLGKAIEVARYHKRQIHPNKVHCGEPMCAICALLAVEAELQYHFGERREPKSVRERPSGSRGMCVCGQRLIDGICGTCNG